MKYQKNLLRLLNTSSNRFFAKNTTKTFSEQKYPVLDETQKLNSRINQMKKYNVGTFMKEIDLNEKPSSKETKNQNKNDDDDEYSDIMAGNFNEGIKEFEKSFSEKNLEHNENDIEIKLLRDVSKNKDLLKFNTDDDFSEIEYKNLSTEYGSIKNLKHEKKKIEDLGLKKT